MKIYLGLIIAAMLMTGTVNAQHVNIGIKGGLNLYNVNNDNNVNYFTKPGIHLGLLSHIHIDKHVAFQPELVYSSQGAKYNSGNDDNKLKLGYINVPLMLQYMFDNGFRLEAGPQVGFLASAKSENNGVTTDVKNNFKSTDFALGIGLGYIKPSTGFGFDARYNLGLSNINESSSVKSTNRGFQLGVFYQFKHK